MRIRTTKPEFWTSDDVAAHDWETRLLFIGLWSYVDDNGVGRDNEKLIVADLFPLEEDPRDTIAKVSRGLQNLFSSGQISRYTVDGRSYLHVTNWHHQKIDRPAKPRYPLPTCANAILATSSRESRDGLDAVPGDQGIRGSGLQTPSAAADQPTLDVVTPDGATERDQGPTNLDRQFAEFWATYPRRVGKDDGRKAWDRARKRASIEAILAGAQRVAADPNLPEQKFIAHPATWLNRGGWDDEPFPGRGRAANPRREMFDAWDRNAAAIDAGFPAPPMIGA